MKIFRTHNTQHLALGEVYAGLELEVENMQRVETISALLYLQIIYLVHEMIVRKLGKGEYNMI